MNNKDKKDKISSQLPEVSSNDLVYSFEGPFYIDTISAIGKDILTKIEDNNFLKKKIFRIFIEMAQNIARYSDEVILNGKRVIGSGILQLISTDTHYIITTSNKISKENANILLTRCSIINGMNHDRLREMKRLQRNAIPLKNIGARIGLIHMALVSHNKLETHVENIDHDSCMFTLKVKIQKQS